jgi:hypothetical protein
MIGLADIAVRIRLDRKDAILEVRFRPMPPDPFGCAIRTSGRIKRGGDLEGSGRRRRAHRSSFLELANLKILRLIKPPVPISSFHPINTNHLLDY